jgi:hypothetical protein
MKSDTPTVSICWVKDKVDIGIPLFFQPVGFPAPMDCFNPTGLVLPSISNAINWDSIITSQRPIPLLIQIILSKPFHF